MNWKASLFCIGLLLPCALFSQGEASNWYFGNGAAIRFNNDGSVTTLDDSSIDTFEGCATISDPFGNLLFYTDGVIVYNKDHEIMENGEGLFGDSSSSQSAIVVPKPEDSSIYYLFTVDTSPFEGDPDFGFNYSVVDMRLDGGLGAVTQKNINLLPDCSEKVAAVVKDCFDKSIWVVTVAGEDGLSEVLDTFHAFEISTEGVNVRPVKSTFSNLDVVDPRGYMKFTSDNTKLVSANATQGLFLYDFDVDTGLVSNQEEIIINGVNHVAYGVEFSPNNRYLYVHASNEEKPNIPHSSSLLQYDIFTPNISSSVVELDNRGIFRGALQQGENGKIYRTIADSYSRGTPFLGVIHNPNQKGIAANYEHNAISLNNNNATQGLPPFVQSFFSKTALIKNPDGTTSSSLTVCDGDGFTLEADNIPGATYFWEKDGIPFTVPADYVYTLPTTLPMDSGRYSVEIRLANPDACPIYSEALIQVLPIPPAQIPVTQCDLDLINSTDGLTQIDLEQLNEDPTITYYIYESIADRNNDNRITNLTAYENTQAFTQTLYYRAINVAGCTYLGEVALQVLPVSITTSPHGPFHSCDDDPNDTVLESTFDLDEIAASYGNLSVDFFISLEDIATGAEPLPDEFVTTSTILYARLQNGAECLGVEEIELIVNPSPKLEMEDTYVYCTDSRGLQISGPDGFDTYRWLQSNIAGDQEIGMGQSILINASGSYILETSVNYTVNGNVVSCENSVEFNVTPSSSAIIEQININDFAANNTVEIQVDNASIYEFSLDGINYQSSNLFTNVEPGFMTAYIRDTQGCGITEQDISVMGYPKFFTPNGDGINDFWQITGINDQLQAGAFIGIYDRYGNFITQINPSDQGWNGTARAKSVPATDYWFRITLKNGKTIKGHFALKR